MKIARSFKMSQETIEKIEELAKETGKTYTQILEEAINLYYSNETHVRHEIELYKRENEQLKIALQFLKEREKTIEKVEETYKLLIDEKDKRLEEIKKEKDERIKELQERINELSRKKPERPFWKFWSKQ